MWWSSHLISSALRGQPCGEDLCTGKSFSKGCDPDWWSSRINQTNYLQRACMTVTCNCCFVILSSILRASYNLCSLSMNEYLFLPWCFFYPLIYRSYCFDQPILLSNYVPFDQREEYACTSFSSFKREKKYTTWPK